MPSVTLGLIVAAMGALPGVATAAGPVITEFTLPNAGSVPNGIAAGPDGNVWFAEYSGNRIGRITPAGVITEFPVPTPNSQPNGIVTGPDKNLWFTEMAGNKIGRITTSGTITEFPVPTPNAEPRHIAAGADGNLWFTEFVANKIGRITTAGVITEFVVPNGRQRPLRDRGGSAMATSGSPSMTGTTSRASRPTVRSRSSRSPRAAAIRSGLP